MTINHIEYKIRRAKIEDALKTNKIIYDTIKFVNSNDYNKKQINTRLTNRTKKIKYNIKNKINDIFVITLNNKIFGVVTLTLNKNELTQLYTKHNQIRKGFGKELLIYAEKYAKKRGIKYLQFDSTLTAYEFYKSQRYKRIKKVNHISNSVNIPCIRMKKIL